MRLVKLKRLPVRWHRCFLAFLLERKDDKASCRAHSVLVAMRVCHYRVRKLQSFLAYIGVWIVLKVYILYVQLDVKEACIYYFHSILLYVENLPNLVHPWLVCRAILPLHYVHLYVLHYQYQRNVKLHFLL